MRCMRSVRFIPPRFLPAFHCANQSICFPGSLIAALEALPNLRTFRWYGENPTLSSAVLEALERGSSEALADLDIP